MDKYLEFEVNFDGREYTITCPFCHKKHNLDTWVDKGCSCEGEKQIEEKIKVVR